VLLSEPGHVADLASLNESGNQLIAHALGRSYGDAALNTDHRAVRTTQLDRVLEFDRDRGVIVCEAGISLDDLISIALPHGWFVPLTPGTRFVSIGGCFAADVHGKNHHVAGTFSQHVQWFDLLNAEGETIRCSQTENSDLFHATAGGMGLTGLVIRVALKLKAVESAYVSVRHEKSYSLADTMQLLTTADADWESTVAWIDGLASGSSLGCGEVIVGRPTLRTELPSSLSFDPLKIPTSPSLRVPFDLPVNIVHKPIVSAFNLVRFRRIREGETVESIQQFYYPLDAVGNWNRLYGPRGFHQYQFVIPDDGAETVIGDTLNTIKRAGLLPVLVVLKRFGEGSGWLSFPMRGWTLAVDLPSHSRLFDVLDDLDERIIAAGGRVYLAKDSRLSRHRFRQMYTEYERWVTVKREIDPRCRFSSDLSRRLGIDDDVSGGGS